MRSTDFIELAGRIEGAARLSLQLVAVLEEAGIIDGPRFSAGLRQSIRLVPDSPAHLRTAQHTLAELADALDVARTYRQSQAGSGQSPKD